MRRCVASCGERPREVNVWRELRSGALDGAEGVVSVEASLGGGLEVGLEENKDETTSWGGLEWEIVVLLTFCLLAGLAAVVASFRGDSCVGIVVGMTDEPEGASRDWSLLRRNSAPFLAVNLAFQRPPRKMAFDPMMPSSTAKFIKSPSSAIESVESSGALGDASWCCRGRAKIKIIIGGK